MGDDNTDTFTAIHRGAAADGETGFPMSQSLSQLRKFVSPEIIFGWPRPLAMCSTQWPE